MIAWLSASSVFQPKFMVPRQMRETDRPLRPRCVCSMESHPGTLDAVPQNDELSAFDAATTVQRAEGGGLVTVLDGGWDVGGGILNGGFFLLGGGRGARPGRPPEHPGAPSGRPPRAPAARPPPPAPRPRAARRAPGPPPP